MSEKRRYYLGPFEDPNEPPKAVMCLDAAIDTLRSYFTEGMVDDELRFRIVELTDEEVDALPEL